MAGSNRLLKEYRELLKAGDEQYRRPDGSLNPIQLQPVTPTNLTKWTASILAPPATPYAHHRFTLTLTIPPTYPHSPPIVHFVTPIAHPNVHPSSGEICLDILADAWTPIWTLESVCRAVQTLMSGGDASSPLNCDMGNLQRDGDWRGYWSVARMWTIEHAERVEEDTEQERREEGWKAFRQEHIDRMKK